MLIAASRGTGMGASLRPENPCDVLPFQSWGLDTDQAPSELVAGNLPETLSRILESVLRSRILDILWGISYDAATSFLNSRPRLSTEASCSNHAEFLRILHETGRTETVL